MAAEKNIFMPFFSKLVKTRKINSILIKNEAQAITKAVLKLLCKALEVNRNKKPKFMVEVNPPNKNPKAKRFCSKTINIANAINTTVPLTI